jgi:hypothetical protein
MVASSAGQVQRCSAAIVTQACFTRTQGMHCTLVALSPVCTHTGVLSVCMQLTAQMSYMQAAKTSQSSLIPSARLALSKTHLQSWSAYRRALPTQSRSPAATSPHSKAQALRSVTPARSHQMDPCPMRHVHVRKPRHASKTCAGSSRRQAARTLKHAPMHSFTSS